MSDREVDSTRIVADADVLAADVLVGGAARESLDYCRDHSWLALVASDALLADAQAVIATLGDAALAADWRNCIEDERVAVEHPPDDHPGLASAYHGDAPHLLTYDDRLTSAAGNLTVQPHAALSIRSPAAFSRLFDPEAVYETVFEVPYPGPDRRRS